VSKAAVISHYRPETVDQAMIEKEAIVLVMAADVSELLQQLRNYTTHCRWLSLSVVIDAILMSNEN
jgi:hypothetical protein